MSSLSNINKNVKSNFSTQKISYETEKIISSIGKALLLIIIISLLIYLIYYSYIYYTINCENKISYFKYLVNFGNKGICIIDNSPLLLEEETIINNKTNINENKDEVFQISNQIYTYDEAKCKCSSYGARLATKNELTQAYNNGAHWCNYGWIEGNEAYYPVQQCELDRKAKNVKEYQDLLKKHYEDPQKYTLKMVNEMRQKMYRENAFEFCGNVSGLNGGKFDNNNLKFGVTCYGKKPEGMSVREKDAKCNENQKMININEEEEEKINSKCLKSSDDNIVSFNPDKWSI